MENRALRGIGRFGKRFRAFIALAGGAVVGGDVDASQPQTVAPLPTTPDWIAECNTKYADFGIWVTTAGDVNGDGYSDVIVGARYYNNNHFNEGAAFLFLGAPEGPPHVPARSHREQPGGRRARLQGGHRRRCERRRARRCPRGRLRLRRPVA